MSTVSRQPIAAAGLADRFRIEVRDYRALPPDATFDQVVSAGMCELVAPSELIQPAELAGFETRLRKSSRALRAHAQALG